MSKEFLKAVSKRRSFYGISKESVGSDDKIREVIEEAVSYAPSAFNSQSARIVLLLDQEHDKFWDIAMEALRKVVPADSFASTEEKINSFKSGYGTVVYFEDQQVVTGLQQQFSLYKDNFPVWSEQASGMLQFIVWTALEEEGFGASLQHYNELIADTVKKEWDLPAEWKMIGQMPFGKPTAAPGEKAMNPLEGRIKIFK